MLCDRTATTIADVLDLPRVGERYSIGYPSTFVRSLDLLAWNDNPARWKSDVLEALRAVAEGS
jgi:hypothetical protein